MKKILLITWVFVYNLSFAQNMVKFNSGTSLCDTGLWRLVWHDEFDGDKLDTKKWYTFIDDDNWINGQVADPPVSEAARATRKVIYKDSNASVNNGACTLTIKYQPTTWINATRNFTSGMLLAKNTQGTQPLYFTQGRYEIRAKLPKATGVWATFWLFGGGTNQQQGSEIDMIEYRPCQSDLNTVPYHVHGFHRGENFDGHYEISGSYQLADPEEWHVYTTEWDRNFIRFFLDGELKRTVSRYGTDCQPDTGRIYIADEQNVFPRQEEGMKMLLTLDYTHDLYSRKLAGICLPMPAWLRNRDKADARQPERKFIIDYVRVYQREGQIQANLKP